MFGTQLYRILAAGLLLHLFTPAGLVSGASHGVLYMQTLFLQGAAGVQLGSFQSSCNLHYAVASLQYPVRVAVVQQGSLAAEQLQDSPAARQTTGVMSTQPHRRYSLALTGTARIDQDEKFQIALQITGCGQRGFVGSRPLEPHIQDQLLRGGMSDPAQEMEYRGPQTVYPIRHDPVLESIQRQTMWALDVQAPKVILTTLPHGVRGVQAVEDIAAGELVFSFPWKDALVVPEAQRRSPFPNFIPHDTWRKSFRCALCGVCKVETGKALQWPNAEVKE